MRHRSQNDDEQGAFLDREEDFRPDVSQRFRVAFLSSCPFFFCVTNSGFGDRGIHGLFSRHPLQGLAIRI